MSESRLDQSLESIISSRKQSTRKGRGGRRSDAGRPAATAAPVGGVKKSTKQPKQPKAAPAGPAAAVGGESKIMISNLPLDVEQNQLQVCKTVAGL
jgi:THO complex subunit 4